MRRIIARLAYWLIVLAGLIMPVQILALDVPSKPTSGPVVDLANVLNDQQEAQLSSTIEEARKKTGNQIGILVIPSLEGESLEEYSIKVARGWGVGDKERDNGVLVLAVINERKLRIEVGYGLEGSLTDARSSRIIRDRIAPEFKQARYYEGLESGLQGINAAIQNEVDPKLNQEPAKDNGGFSLEWLAFLLFALPSWLASILARTKSWWAGGVIGAIIGGIVGVFWGFLYVGLIAAIVLAVIGLVFDKVVSSNYRRRRADGLEPSWWAGGSTLGGGKDGGWGGFGGGGFGGGGSSGDW